MKTAATVIDLLGGARVLGRRVSSEKELVLSLQEGLPYRALEAVKRRLHLSDSELSQAIDIHPRTLMRRKSQKRLRSDESDRLSRLLRVTSQAIDVLGDESMRWPGCATPTALWGALHRFNISARTWKPGGSRRS